MVVVGKSVGDYVARYCGTEEHNKDSEFEHTLISHTMGVDLSIAEFRDTKEFEEYSTRCSHMKSLLVGM